MPKDREPGPDVCQNLVDPRSVPFTYGRIRGRLPHLYKAGCTFFVTFCLQDAVPAWAARRRELESDERPDRVAARSEPVLDRGSMILGRPEAGRVVENALTFFQGERYGLHGWVVMPNHVHVVMTPFRGQGVSEILHSWKSFTAKKINRLSGSEGRLWQAESFDHVIRHEHDLVRYVDYVEQNPVAAGLCRRAEDWPFSSARYRR